MLEIGESDPFFETVNFSVEHRPQTKSPVFPHHVLVIFRKDQPNRFLSIASTGLLLHYTVFIRNLAPLRTQTAEFTVSQNEL